jgi:FMN reductase
MNMLNRRLKLLSISGSPRNPSRTEALVTAIGRSVANRVSAEWRHFGVPEIAPAIMPALTAKDLSAEGHEVIARVESADILVVGTPVYRASFTGLLKHLFDLVRFDALRGRISVLAATGGSPLHGLIAEHQLRPLMSFFGTHTVPTTIYAEERDFTEYEISNPAIRQRIENAAEDVARLIDGRSPVAHETVFAEGG